MLASCLGAPGFNTGRFLCESCGGWSSTGTGFWPSSIGFPLLITIPTLPHVNHSSGLHHNMISSVLVLASLNIGLRKAW